jgi:hypothetical protein
MEAKGKRGIVEEDIKLTMDETFKRRLPYSSLTFLIAMER